MDERNIEYTRSNANRRVERIIKLMPVSIERHEAKLAKKYSKHKGHALNKLADFFNDIEVIYEYVREHVVCKKGCSSCCHIPVSISEVEIQYIEKNTGLKRNPKKYTSADSGDTACPMLVDGSCSIYEFRPYMCRRHVTLTNTNYWCDINRAFDIELPLLGYSEADRAYDIIRKEAGNKDISEIRSVFSRIAK